MISIEKCTAGYVLTAQQRLAAPLERVFAFFSDAFNLESITPPWLKFRVLTEPPIVMRPGLRIDYRLRMRGFPMKWQSEITVWEPPNRFVDEQRIGPYRRWHHEHRFEPCPGGVIATDRVEYSVPGGAFIHALLVRRDVRTIFDYRRQALARVFGELPSPEEAPIA
ncbi:MAG: SRPBCC family protein [Phycisphaerales bacterium]|nr:SRPBCC family protein [Phycisphaerales bacterium]